MKRSKPTYEDVELYHDKGEYVIICLPEYLSDIQQKLAANSISHYEPETVVSERHVDGNTLSTIEMYINELRLPHHDSILTWFEMNKHLFQPDTPQPEKQ